MKNKQKNYEKYLVKGPVYKEHINEDWSFMLIKMIDIIILI